MARWGSITISHILFILFIIFILSFFAGISAASSQPEYQSVSGEYAREWLNKSGAGGAGYSDSGETDSSGSTGNKADSIINEIAASNASNGSRDLWKWGSAPRGSEIVDGELVTDPNYLHSLLNLSSNWLSESYTDSTTGIPVNTYLDPYTGRTYYVLLNPTTGDAFFTYYTYTDSKTGRLVYVYTDPSTGEEVTASAKPTELIYSLAEGLSGQTTYSSQSDPWIRL